MEKANEIRLDELLFGRTVAPTEEPNSALAEFISVWYRKALARVPRDKAAETPSLPPPPSDFPS
jgi:hypothetical protein